MDTDGQTVTPEVSEGTPEPTVTTTAAPDPIEAKIQAKVQEALKAQETEIARRIQSEADKRAAPLYRRLTEAEAKAQALEQALDTLPRRLGPDVDPTVPQVIRQAGTEARLSAYQRRDFAAQQEAQEEQIRQSIYQTTRERVRSLGVDPDDPRIKYDMNLPTPADFVQEALSSAFAVKDAETQKGLDAKIEAKLAEREAKGRRESGVDNHEVSGTSGKPIFKASQFLDRKFYKAHQKEMDEAHLEGRVIKEQ